MVAVWHVILVVVLIVTSSCVATSSTRKNDSQLGRAHYKLGLAYLSENRTQASFLEFQKAVRLNPDDKASWNLLGYLHTKLEHYTEGEEAYLKAIAIDPDYSDAYNNLGVLYSQLKRWDDAVSAFNKALANPLYKTPQKALNNLGYAQMQQGDYGAAERSFREALQRGKAPRAHYNLALVYFHQGADDRAVSALKSAVFEAPGYVDAHWRLAQYYLDRGTPDLAVPHLEAVARLVPEDERGRSAKRYLGLIRGRSDHSSTLEASGRTRKGA